MNPITKLVRSVTFCASGSRRALGGNSRVESSANHLTAITKDITDTAACLKACGYANSKAKYSGPSSYFLSSTSLCITAPTINAVKLNQ